MHPMHAAYMLGLEKAAGLGGFLAKGLSGVGKGLAGLGINMAASEVADHFLEKKPQVNKVFVHPGVYQRMRAAQLKGEEPADILKRFSGGGGGGQSPAPMLPNSMLKGTGAPRQPWLGMKG